MAGTTTSSGEAEAWSFQLFDGAKPPRSDRRWGHDQAIRPGILVKGLQKVVAAAKARGVQFTGDIEANEFGQQIEFQAPEGILWTLSEIAGARDGTDFSKPNVGIAELKANNLPAQVSFYRDVLGMRIESDRSQRVVLVQHLDGPRLVLKGGGTTRDLELAWAERPERSQPIFLSFMASDLGAAARRFRQAGARIMKAMEHHDWGTDLFVADADGNAIQVVQYDVPRGYGERLRAQPPPSHGVAADDRFPRGTRSLAPR